MNPSLALKLRPFLTTVFARAAEYTANCEATMAYHEALHMAAAAGGDQGLYEDAVNFAERYWRPEHFNAPSVTMTRDERVLFFGFLSEIAAYEGV